MAEAVAGLPFTIASRASKRQSFTLPNVALAAAAPVTPPGTPVQIPAVGYLRSIRLEVTATITGGGAATLAADAPWNLISNLAFKNSAGQNLIAPMSGYELYILNKYGAQGAGITSGYGLLADPKAGRQYTATPTAIHFFLDVPFEIDPSSGLGCIPALASNRSYQLELSFAAISTVFGGTVPTAVSLNVDATAVYWDLPVGQTPGGTAQSTEPFGLGTLSLWQKETPVLAPGEQLTRSNNTGNVIRNLIFIARTAAGARTDVDFPTTAELYVDNNPMLRYKKTEWQDDMARQYGLTASALDAVGGLDTGVYVIPFHLLAGGLANDPSNSRAQLLATLDATLLQFKGYNWGASISQVAIITQAIASDNAQFIYSK